MSNNHLFACVEAPPLTQEQERILAAIGVTLLLLQAAEKLVNVCMMLVFQKESPLTIEKLTQQRKDEQKKTLGYFLAELRKRAELDPNFDNMLRDFLEYRNTFVHRLGEVPGFGLDSPEEMEVANRFLGKLMGLTQHMTGIFGGFIRAWEKQINMPMPIPPGSEPVIAEIDRLYTPFVDQLVFEKQK